MPTLTAYINDTMVVTINNRLPAWFPQVSSGISLHWHGLGMWDNNTWADGTAYVTQCPVQAGNSYTYEFLLDDAPGTYIWHDHSSVNRADGLQGALILELAPESPVPNPFRWNGGDRILMVTDWWDDEANAMAMRLNRPYDTSNAPADAGAYVGVRKPDALLINGKGMASDCDEMNIVTGVKETYAPPFCNVTQLSVKPQPGKFSGCRHAEWTVAEGKTHLFRIMNAAASTYITVCFEGHSIEVFFADATPVEAYVLDNGCIDLGSGQRYDVALTAKPNSANAGQKVFWVSVHSQYRTASPSAYGIMRYKGASTGTLPPTPTPQNTIEPWYLETSYIRTHEGVMGYLDNYQFLNYWQLFAHRGLYNSAAVNTNVKANTTVVLNMTMPLMKDTGQIRWAMNNIAMPSNAPCTPVLRDILQDPSYLQKNLVNPTPEARAAATKAILGVQTWNRTDRPQAFDGKQPAPIIPAAGMHVVTIEWGEVVDVVMVNQPASASNGDYRGVNRTFMDHHPMHLHGHKFWIIGQGYGTFDPATDWDNPTLNFHNPMLRDTATIPPGGWLFIRFLANNPGAWPLHCHLLWHAYMGQMLYFLEALDRVPPPPAVMARCPDTCVANFAPYTKSWINATFPNSKFQMP